ncbi:MAG TPA: hypothetical protein VKB80_18465 [Kofleriaceae bacterium]|nr:hypothetical protein [Kofleriaceae bacterium]
MEATLNRANRNRAIGGGILAGLIAGALMTAYMMAMNVHQGRDLWLALKGAGTPILHDRARDPGFDAYAVLIGGGVHFAISALWGLVFSILFFGASRLGTVALGAAWGIVCWLVMFYLVLPIAGMSAVPKMVPIGQAILEHVGFGLAIAIAFLPFQRPRRQREASLADLLGGEPR